MLLETTGHRLTSYHSSVVKVLIASKGQILLAAPSSCQGVSKKLPMISFSSFIIGRLSNASRFLSSLILLSMICLEGRNPQLTWDLNSTLELSLCQGLFSDKITDVLFQHRYSFLKIARVLSRSLVIGFSRICLSGRRNLLFRTTGQYYTRRFITVKGIRHQFQKLVKLVCF